MRGMLCLAALGLAWVLPLGALQLCDGGDYPCSPPSTISPQPPPSPPHINCTTRCAPGGSCGGCAPNGDCNQACDGLCGACRACYPVLDKPLLHTEAQLQGCAMCEPCLPCYLCRDCGNCNDCIGTCGWPASPPPYWPSSSPPPPSPSPPPPLPSPPLPSPPLLSSPPPPPPSLPSPPLLPSPPPHINCTTRCAPGGSCGASCGQSGSCSAGGTCTLVCGQCTDCYPVLNDPNLYNATQIQECEVCRACILCDRCRQCDTTCNDCVETCDWPPFASPPSPPSPPPPPPSTLAPPPTLTTVEMPNAPNNSAARAVAAFGILVACAVALLV